MGRSRSQTHDGATSANGSRSYTPPKGQATPRRSERATSAAQEARRVWLQWLAVALVLALVLGAIIWLGWEGRPGGTVRRGFHG